MRIQHGLYLSDVSIIFCDIDKAGVKSVFSYTLTDAGYLEKLQAFLREHQPGAFNVYLDLMGEEYKQESIPHIGGNDRELLLDRKSKSLFPAADLVWKKHLRREKRGRKDDVYLLVGVSLPSSIEQIFDALVQTKLQIAGVYSLSILEQETQLGFERSEQSLLVSRVLGSAEGKRIYRQTFFKEGELAMSRVTSINGETDEQVFSQLMVEIERMRHFLTGTRQLNSASKLAVRTVFSEEESKRFLQYDTKNEQIKIECIQLTDLAVSNGLEKVGEYSSLAELLIVGVSQKHMNSHFKPKGLIDAFNVLKTKCILGRVAAGLLVFSVCVAGFVAYMASVEKGRVQALNSSVQELRKHRESLFNNVQITEIEPRKMKQVVELYNNINAYQFGPDKVLDVIARAYRGFNQISLDKLSWLNDSLEQRNTRGQGGYAEPFMLALKKPRQFELKIALLSNLGNRVILNKVSDFLSALREQPEIIEVRRERAMLDTSADAEMAESLAEGVVQNKQVEFTLLITMEL